MKSRHMCCMLAIVIASMPVGIALAQRPAGSKITGNAYNFYSGSMHTRHARDHANVLRYYNEPAAVKYQAQQVQQNVAAAKAAVQKAKPQAKDKESQDLIKALEAHYAACDEHCKKLMAGGMDEKAMADCCGDLVKSLDAAQADHDKLMTKLGVEPLEPTGGEKK